MPSTYVAAAQIESVGQTLSRSWHVYRITFLSAFSMALLLSVIEFLPRILTLIFGIETFQIAAHYNYFRGTVIIANFINIILFTAILWRMQNVLVGQRESVKTDYKIGSKKFPAIVAAALIQLFLYCLIFLTAIAAWVSIVNYTHLDNGSAVNIFLHGIPIMLGFLLTMFVFVLFYFYMPLILTESNGPITSLDHSGRLVWGNWWKSFWVIATPWLLYTVAILVLKAIGLNLHVFIIETPIYDVTWLGTLVHIILFAIFVPWFASTMLVQLRNLELIHGERRVRAKRTIA